MQALTTLIKCFPGHMAKWMAQILPSIWNTLTESAAIYVRTVVHDTEDADDPVDSDGRLLWQLVVMTSNYYLSLCD